MKPEAPRAPTRQHAIERQRVRMDVQIHRPAEPLNPPPTPPPLASGQAVRARPPAQVPLDRVRWRMRTTAPAEIVPPRQQIAQAMRRPSRTHAGTGTSGNT